MTRTLSLIVSVTSSLGVINALRASKAYVHVPGEAHMIVSSELRAQPYVLLTIVVSVSS